MLDVNEFDQEFSGIIEIVGDAFFEAHSTGFGLPALEQYQLWKAHMNEVFNLYDELIENLEKKLI